MAIDFAKLRRRIETLNPAVSPEELVAPTVPEPSAGTQAVVQQATVPHVQTAAAAVPEAAAAAMARRPPTIDFGNLRASLGFTVPAPSAGTQAAVPQVPDAAADARFEALKEIMPEVAAQYDRSRAAAISPLALRRKLRQAGKPLNDPDAAVALAESEGRPLMQDFSLAAHARRSLDRPALLAKLRARMPEADDATLGAELDALVEESERRGATKGRRGIAEAFARTIGADTTGASDRSALAEAAGVVGSALTLGGMAKGLAGVAGQLIPGRRNYETVLRTYGDPQGGLARIRADFFGEENGQGTRTGKIGAQAAGLRTRFESPEEAHRYFQNALRGEMVRERNEELRGITAGGKNVEDALGMVLYSSRFATAQRVGRSLDKARHGAGVASAKQARTGLRRINPYAMATYVLLDQLGGTREKMAPKFEMGRDGTLKVSRPGDGAFLSGAKSTGKEGLDFLTELAALDILKGMGRIVPLPARKWISRKAGALVPSGIRKLQGKVAEVAAAAAAKIPKTVQLFKKGMEVTRAASRITGFGGLFEEIVVEEGMQGAYSAALNLENDFAGASLANVAPAMQGLLKEAPAMAVSMMLVRMGHVAAGFAGSTFASKYTDGTLGERTAANMRVAHLLAEMTPEQLANMAAAARIPPALWRDVPEDRRRDVIFDAVAGDLDAALARKAEDGETFEQKVARAVEPYGFHRAVPGESVRLEAEQTLAAAIETQAESDPKRAAAAQEALEAGDLDAAAAALDPEAAAEEAVAAAVAAREDAIAARIGELPVRLQEQAQAVWDEEGTDAAADFVEGLDPAQVDAMRAEDEREAEVARRMDPEGNAALVEAAAAGVNPVAVEPAPPPEAVAVPEAAPVPAPSASTQVDQQLSAAVSPRSERGTDQASRPVAPEAGTGAAAVSSVSPGASVAPAAQAAQGGTRKSETEPTDNTPPGRGGVGDVPSAQAPSAPAPVETPAAPPAKPEKVDPIKAAKERLAEGKRKAAELAEEKRRQAALEKARRSNDRRNARIERRRQEGPKRWTPPLRIPGQKENPFAKSRRLSLKSFLNAYEGAYPLLEHYGFGGIFRAPTAKDLRDTGALYDGFMKLSGSLKMRLTGRGKAKGSVDSAAAEAANIIGRQEYAATGGHDQLIADFVAEVNAYQAWRDNDSKHNVSSALDAVRAWAESVLDGLPAPAAGAGRASAEQAEPSVGSQKRNVGKITFAGPNGPTTWDVYETGDPAKPVRLVRGNIVVESSRNGDSAKVWIMLGESQVPPGQLSPVAGRLENGVLRILDGSLTFSQGATWSDAVRRAKAADAAVSRLVPKGANALADEFQDMAEARNLPKYLSRDPSADLERIRFQVANTYRALRTDAARAAFRAAMGDLAPEQSAPAANQPEAPATPIEPQDAAKPPADAAPAAPAKKPRRVKSPIENLSDVERARADASAANAADAAEAEGDAKGVSREPAGAVPPAVPEAPTEPSATSVAEDEAADADASVQEAIPAEEDDPDSPVPESREEVGTLFPLTPAAKPRRRPAPLVSDFGEKIGGARKDIAVPTGPRPTGAARNGADSEPAWRRQFKVWEQTKRDYMDHMMKRPGKPTGRWIIAKVRGSAILSESRESWATKEEAETAVPLYAVAQNHKIRQTRDESYAIVRVLSNGNHPVVRGGFASREDAMRHMAENPVEIIEHQFRMPERPWLDRIGRMGPDLRQGRDIRPQDFQEAFGFRGGEFGNWNMGGDGQAALNYAYDALMDLADALGVPRRALSLDGRLAIAFGARGHGGWDSAAAHYERDKAVINLTKIRGAGSLAHEWFHALDAYLHGLSVGLPRGQTTPDMATEQSFAPRGDLLRPELRQAFIHVLKAMTAKAQESAVDPAEADHRRNRAEDGLRNALDQLRRDIDMLARSNYARRARQLTDAEAREWDRLASLLLAGDRGQAVYITGRTRMRGRESFENIRALNDIYKAATGRSFDRAENSRGQSVLWGARAVADANQRIAAASAGKTEVKTRRTAFFDEAKKIDSYRASDYWSTPVEMGARAFESYILDKLTAGERSSQYLVHGAENKYYAQLDMKPYPKGDERKAINAAFQTLFDTIQTRQEDGRTILFQADAADATAPSALPGAPRVEEVRERFGDVLRLLPGVEVVQSLADLPPAVRARVERSRRQQGIAGRPRAFTDAGRFYIVADYFRSLDDVLSAFPHELSHIGLEGVPQETLEVILAAAQAHAARDKQFREMLWEIQRRYPGLDLSTPHGRNIYVGEIVAKVAERRLDLRMRPLWHRIVAALRDWLRAVGRALGVADYDPDRAAVEKWALHAVDRGIARMRAVSADIPDAVGDARMQAAEEQGEFSLESATPAQLKGEERRRLQREKLRQLAARPLKGEERRRLQREKLRQLAARPLKGGAPIDTTFTLPGMEDTGDLFNQIDHALSAGNDGVIIRNVKDNYNTMPGDKSPATTTYATFRASQIKSADAFTYRDDGTLIPLSERFRPESPDIRFQAGDEGESPAAGAAVPAAPEDPLAADLAERLKAANRNLKRAQGNLEKARENVLLERRKQAELRKGMIRVAGTAARYSGHPVTAEERSIRAALRDIVAQARKEGAAHLRYRDADFLARHVLDVAAAVHPEKEIEEGSAVQIPKRVAFLAQVMDALADLDARVAELPSGLTPKEQEAALAGLHRDTFLRIVGRSTEARKFVEQGWEPPARIVGAFRKEAEKRLKKFWTKHWWRFFGGETVTGKVSAMGRKVPAHPSKGILTGKVFLSASVAEDARKLLAAAGIGADNTASPPLAMRTWQEMRDLVEQAAEIAAQSEMDRAAVVEGHKTRREESDAVLAAELERDGPPRADSALGNPRRAPLARWMNMQGRNWHGMTAWLAGGRMHSFLRDTLEGKTWRDHQRFLQIKSEWHRELLAKAAELGWTENDMARMSGEAREWKLLDGRKVRLTVCEVGSLFGMLQNADAADKLAHNGARSARFRNNTQFAEDRRIDPLNLEKLNWDERAAARLAQYQALVAQLDPKVREFIRWQVAKNGERAALANETSRRLHGVDKFTNPSFWTLVGAVDKPAKITDRDPEAKAGKPSGGMLERAGITKERQMHRHVILLGDMFSVVKNHGDQLAAYIAMAETEHDLMQWLSVGKFHDALVERIGSEGIAHLKGYVRRMTGQEGFTDDLGTLSRLVSTVQGNMAVGILGLRATSIMANRVGGSALLLTMLARDYGAAAAARFLGKGVAKPLRSRWFSAKASAIAETLLQNGYLYERWVDTPFQTFAQVIAPPDKTSRVTGRRIQGAGLAWRKFKQWTMKPMSWAELRNAIDLYETLVEEGLSQDAAVQRVVEYTATTQNPSTPLEQNGWYVRSKSNALSSTIFPFFGQPTVMQNLVAQSVTEAARMWKDGDKVKARRWLGTALIGLILSALWSAAARAFVRDARKSRVGVDDRDTPERARAAGFDALSELAQAINPVGSDVVRILQRATADKPSYFRPMFEAPGSMITRVFDSGNDILRNVGKALQGDESAQLRVAKSAAAIVSFATGAPLGGPIQAAEVTAGLVRQAAD